MLANRRPKPAIGFPYKKTGYGARHVQNAPGSKRLRKMYRNVVGKRGTAEEAAAWYAMLTEKFPKMPYPLGDARNP